MLFILSAVGIAGAVILGVDGLMLGASGQLERIWAIACLAMAAGGLVGMMADDHRRERKPHPNRVERGDILHLIAVAPIMLLCLGVFVATLIPSMYVMLPVFLIWWYGSEARPKKMPPPPIEAPVHAPAYA